jgi:hypothetical protein
MAAATLTLPDRSASLPVPAAPPAKPTILALDLGTTTGWALHALDGLIASGSVSFPPAVTTAAACATCASPTG